MCHGSMVQIVCLKKEVAMCELEYFEACFTFFDEVAPDYYM